MTYTVHERLSPEIFIDRIKTAPKWVLIHSEDLPVALELYIKTDNLVECFVTPDFTQMRELEVKVFLARLDDVITNPEIMDHKGF